MLAGCGGGGDGGTAAEASAGQSGVGADASALATGPTERRLAAGAGQVFSAGAAPAKVDHDGDGKSDLLWYNAVTGQTTLWLMNGTGVIDSGLMLTDPNFKIIGTADLNGDGKSDLLWYNAVTGQTTLWMMSGTAVIGSGLLLTDPNFKLIGTGDLNGDGKADLLWYNAATGQTTAWLMNGTAAIGSGVLLTDPNFKIIAVADVNGDGKSDLLWYNAGTGQTTLWLMNGTGVIDSGLMLTDPSFKITATADLNGDGKADLLWYNPATGQTTVWMMSGKAVIGSGLLLTDPNFKLAGTGDFNGDAKSDLLWYNGVTGQTTLWLMSGTAAIGSGLMLTDPNFKIAGTADLNGDGKSDLLWYNAVAGQTTGWMLNGTGVIGSDLLLTDPNFRPVPPPAKQLGLPGSLPWLDTQNRDAVEEFYRVDYLSSENMANGWTGNHSTCNPGTTTAAFDDAILRRINYFRAMSGIPAVKSFLPEYSQKAQATALMMSVNGRLSHTPDNTWVCYSTDGAAGAGSSDISLGVFGPAAISNYILDPGSANYPVGHRRWILYPQTQHMGTGDIPSASGKSPSNALWVIDADNIWGVRPATRDIFVAWPPRGYVPRQLVFSRWSFSYPLADFSTTSVSIARNGNAVGVSVSPVLNGYGENTIVWEMDEQLPPGEVRYTVTLQSVKIDSIPQDFSYDVIIVDPSN